MDGLRPDAVRADTMPWLSWLRESCWSAREARTVSPSITVAALASLGSGL
ncbi:MAG: alkaline phosphatase family protein, partial [Gemmatimonadales bacterium]